MRSLKRTMTKTSLPAFKKFLIEDGWELHERLEDRQALKASKLNFKGEKRKWCIINSPPDLDSVELHIPNFSLAMADQFFQSQLERGLSL